MLQRKFSKAAIVLNVFICVVLIILSIIVILNRQMIIDQITVWQFQPTAEVSALVEKSGMSDYGKFMYLASQPNLDGTQNFNSECDRIENTASILGCYKNYRIYIYDITDTQLDGIREVTATHETLHAAYARLSSDTKNRISTLLEAEYAKLEGNKNYTDRMAFYARTEPGERDNELHSVIGTEIADISPELEQYYSMYFSDRQKVVALNTKYSSVFTNLKNRANALADQLNVLSSSINSQSARYNNDVQTLNMDISIFNAKAKSGSFASAAQFASERSALSVRVAAVNALRESVNSDIDTYGIDLKEYNSIATESKTLYNTIDSTLAPAPSV